MKISEGLAKLKSLSKEELDDLFSKLTLLEIESLLDKLNRGVKK